MTRIPGIPGGAAGGPGRWTGGPAPRNTAGRVALVLGIVGLCTSLVVVGGLFGLAALVFGVRGRSLARRGAATNPGVATAGMVIGALAILTAVTFAYGAWTFVEQYGDDYQNYQDCVREARTGQERDACSERFGEDIRRRVDPGGATPAPPPSASEPPNPAGSAGR